MRAGAPRRPAARAALPALAVLLAACATVPAPGPVSDPRAVWAAREQRLARLEDWRLQGRLAIHAGEEGGNLSLLWQQHGSAYRIHLNAPLGQGSVALEGGAGEVVMRSGEGRFTAADAGALMQQRLGWSVPLAGLRYWILGRAQPGVPLEDLQLDAAGRPERLRQSGWQVRYLRWGRSGDLALPTLVYLDTPRVSARIAVDAWTLEPP